MPPAADLLDVESLGNAASTAQSAVDSIAARRQRHHVGDVGGVETLGEAAADQGHRAHAPAGSMAAFGGPRRPIERLDSPAGVKQDLAGVYDIGRHDHRIRRPVEDDDKPLEIRQARHEERESAFVEVVAKDLEEILNAGQFVAVARRNPLRSRVFVPIPPPPLGSVTRNLDLQSVDQAKEFVVIFAGIGHHCEPDRLGQRCEVGGIGANISRLAPLCDIAFFRGRQRAGAGAAKPNGGVRADRFRPLTDNAWLPTMTRFDLVDCRPLKGVSG